MDREARSELELERLGLVATDVRDAVVERDGQCCRVCGQWVDEPVALHHITFRSQGGLDVPGNLVVIGWSPWHDCHLTHAHGPNARLWRRLLLACIEQPGTTARQLLRWERAAL